MDSFPSPVKQQFFQSKNESIDNCFGNNYNNATGLPFGVNQKTKTITNKLSPKTIINNFREISGDKLALTAKFRRNYLSKKRSGSDLGTALTTKTTTTATTTPTATSHNQPKRLKNCETNENFEKENQPDKSKKNQHISDTTTTATSATNRQRNNSIDSNILNSYGERILNGSDNMSTYHDYHYDSTSNSTNGSSAIASNKYITGAKNHCSATDSYYGTDLSTKQQLCDIALSMASLCNIGNSCYMNSVIYTLRFTPLFLHNLHHLVNDFSQMVNKRETQMKLKSASLGRNVSGLQGQNSRSYSSKDLASLGSSSPSTSTSSSPALEIVKTTQQMAMEKLHDLFKNLTSNEMTESIEPFQSDLLLKAIQDVNPIFEGNQQQDAHEFLMCILDSIRETCQTIMKIINDHPEIIVSSLTENFDRLAVKTTVTMAPTTEKKSASWFKIRNKENKNKNTVVMDSPSKDSNSFDAATSNSDATNSSGSAIESLLLNKQTIQEKIKALGLDFFSEDFEGVTASSIQCLACETTTEQKETMIDLSVPITENMETHELTDSFIQSRCITRERFHGDNKFRCENCMGLTEAIRKISYPKLPRILIIQLKRFSGGMEKINSYYPTPFTLQCFCSACISDHNNSKGHEYKLYSVITHVGSTLQAGHYIAYTCALNRNNIHFDCFKNIQTMVSGTTNATTVTSSSTATATATPTPTPTPTQTPTTISAVNSTSTPMHIGIPFDEVNENSGASTHSMKSPNSTELNRQSSFSSSSSINTSAVRDVMKKIGLGRKKSSANNSIDIGKHAKVVNGLKVSINGVDVNKLANNSNANNTATTVTKIQCPSNSCCGIKMKTNLLINANNQQNNGNDTTLTNGMDYTNGDQSRSKCGTFNSYGDHTSSYFTRSLDDDATKKLIDDDGKKLDEDARKMALRRQRQTNNGGTNSAGSSKLNNEPIWYMCDDDKIKAIPQHEFREMLLPKKNMITPYLLFYARNDVFEPH